MVQRKSWLAWGAVLGWLAAQPAVAAVAPLEPAAKAAMEAVPQDPVPKKLLGQAAGLENKHYLAGNEWHLELYAGKLANLGGIYVGVGSDQSYLLAGMVRPVAAFFMDYDDLVVQIHRAYFTFFAKAADFEAFMKYWDDAELGAKAIEEKLAGDPAMADVKKLYLRYRASIADRLHRVARTFRKAKVPCFVTDAETYTFIRELVAAGRVRALRVDLLANQGMAGIGAAAAKLGQPIRALYLSNAENYWAYTPQFRANVKALPFDAQSRVVRTVSTWDHNHDYVYTLQPALDFQAFVAMPWVKRYRDFIAWPRPQADEFLFKETAPNPAKLDAAHQKAKKG